MITKENFTRINNDVNGKPRYVIHFTRCIKEVEREHAYKTHGPNAIDVLYLLALSRVRATVGGKKYHNKSYGGGIVIQSYNLDYEVNALNKALDDSGQQVEQTKQLNTMEKLLKQYGFEDYTEYFEYIVESVINGQIQQATELFSAMPRENRVEFIETAITLEWESGLDTVQLSKFVEFV